MKYSNEDLINFIKENDLDIQKLAAIASILGDDKKEAEEKEEESTVKAVAKKPGVEFQLALACYPDFCITRTTATTTKQLVIMPSKNKYYITLTKSTGEKDTDVQNLTEDLYADFTAGMEPIELPEDFG